MHLCIGCKAQCGICEILVGLDVGPTRFRAVPVGSGLAFGQLFPSLAVRMTDLEIVRQNVTVVLLLLP